MKKIQKRILVRKKSLILKLVMQSNEKQFLKNFGWEEEIRLLNLPQFLRKSKKKMKMKTPRHAALSYQVNKARFVMTLHFQFRQCKMKSYKMKLSKSKHYAHQHFKNWWLTPKIWRKRNFKYSRWLSKQKMKLLAAKRLGEISKESTT